MLFLLFFYALSAFPCNLFVFFSPFLFLSGLKQIYCLTVHEVRSRKQGVSRAGSLWRLRSDSIPLPFSAPRGARFLGLWPRPLSPPTSVPIIRSPSLTLTCGDMGHLGGGMLSHLHSHHLGGSTSQVQVRTGIPLGAVTQQAVVGHLPWHPSVLTCADRMVLSYPQGA